LNCQFADTLQQIAGGAQATLGRLRQRDTVVGVARSRRIAANLRRETLRNGQTCSVVFCAVDAQTRRQALQRGRQDACEVVRLRCEFSDAMLVLMTCAMMFLQTTTCWAICSFPLVCLVSETIKPLL
jgi:hypothetical protein